jgi:hypothetical protein
MTPEPVNDRNKVKKDVLVQVGLKAMASATTGSKAVIGVTGMWIDDDDGIVEASDAFQCSGVSQVFVDVTAA